MATREAERAKRTALSQALFGQLSAEFGVLEKWLAYSTAQLEARRAAPPGCQRLETSPGMGPLTATALVAAVSETNAFQHGRQFAAWLGRVPRPPATGGKARWWGISNRGAVYRR